MRLALRSGLPSPRLAALSAWAAAFAVLGAVQFLVLRACAYEVQPLVAYAGYFSFHVYLPGLVVMYALQRGPVSWTTSVALGVPTGFALDIFTYLGLAALGAKDWVPLTPVAWMGVFTVLTLRHGAWPLRCRVTVHHAGVALGLALLFLMITVAAVSHMFAESPLVGGLPQRPIFHDWVYLVSRAAVIKHQWPLEDPSLAGVALQYHYFLLVHVASCSWVTGLEITQILLRLAVVPLGAVLVVQAFTLGRMVSRRAWGGLLAALLTVAASEVAFQPHPNLSVFLGRFVRWLFVSPTFYFGMVFFGGLLLAVYRWRTVVRGGVAHVLWLGLLAAAATGAKGTVLPVVLPALLLWFGWSWWRTRVFPWRVMVAGLVCGAMFGLVYQATMAAWGTGAARLVPFDIFEVSDFWRQYHAGWTESLAPWLPEGWAVRVAAVICGAIVILGTLGVRAFALPYLVLPHSRVRRPLVEWLGAVLVASLAMGVLLRLDADGELYVFLMIRLPSAVLAAAFIVRGLEWVRAWRAPVAAGSRRPLLAWAAAAAAAVVLGLQVGLAQRRMQLGYREWVANGRAEKAHEEIGRLEEALMWIRENTETDAVLVANSFTPANLQRDRWGALDGTLTGVHYYYSALSERRLLVEGPNYLLDPERVRARLELAADIFYRGVSPTADMVGSGPAYAVLDREMRDDATVNLPPPTRVFRNARIDVYRLPRTAPRIASANE